MRTLAEIAGIILWCLAVHVCAFDWEDVRDRDEAETDFRKVQEK